MHKLILFVLMFVLSGTLSAEPRRILLDDGTEIVGEIVAFKNGSYTIRSATLGTLTVSDRQVKQISSVRSGSPASSSSNHSQNNSPLETGKSALQSSQVQAIQQQLASDSSMVQRILALQSSPEMQAVLADPEVMAAVQRFDFEALANHPKIKRLMNNQDIQAITREAN
jgi:hypothetical protein